MRRKCKQSKQKKRHERSKSWIALCAVVTVTCLLSGCQKELKADTVEDKKTIVIGYDSFDPYTYLDVNGDMTGIDVEIAKEAFGKLGYEPVYQLIDWEEKDSLLAGGTVDCLWACFTMTDREDKYQWAGPYMYSRQMVAVRDDSGIYELSDLEGKTIAAQATTNGEKLFLNAADYGLPKVKQVVSVSTTDEMYAILRKGYVDAIAGHEGLLWKIVNDGTDSYRLLEDSPYVSELGVAFEKGTHQEVAEELTKTLEEMKKDGSIGQIAEKYGMDPEKAVWGEKQNEE